MLKCDMRTTLEIDTDVLTAIKALSQQRGVTVGQVATELLRVALHADQIGQWKTRNGVPLFPVVDPKTVVTLDFINQLRDETP